MTEPVIVNLENIHEHTYNFIRENNIRVVNFEETMTNVYLQMVQRDYRFIVDRELIHEIFCEIAYRLNPNDPLNSDRLLMTIGMVEDSDDDNDDDDNDEKEKLEKKKTIVVKLSANRQLEIDFIQEDLFYSPSGTPINSSQYVKSLFDDIPQFFENEEDLRNIWINPDTRKKLLDRLDETGHTSENLRKLEDVIRSPNTDIYDILSYIKFDKKPVTRLDRSKFVSRYLETIGNQQRIFVEFVLDQYINLGVSELGTDKLSSLIEIKYGAITDAKKILGDVSSIKSLFIDFQKYLYPQN